jgi:hypothetical protein
MIDLIKFLVFNATFSNISVISWRPVLVVEEAGQLIFKSCSVWYPLKPFGLFSPKDF